MRIVSLLAGGILITAAPWKCRLSQGLSQLIQVRFQKLFCVLVLIQKFETMRKMINTCGLMIVQHQI